MFMLIIWLQGIWLPRHGYSFSQTPLWAGIYMLPLTAGFLLAGPASGILSDRFGSRPFASGGMIAAASPLLAAVHATGLSDTRTDHPDPGRAALDSARRQLLAPGDVGPHDLLVAGEGEVVIAFARGEFVGQNIGADQGTAVPSPVSGVGQALRVTAAGQAKTAWRSISCTSSGRTPATRSRICRATDLDVAQAKCQAQVRRRTSHLPIRASPRPRFSRMWTS